MEEYLDQDPKAASAAFGQRLRDLRAREGVSQDGLARETDVHPTAIGRFERGDREPRLTTILRLARGLGVAPGELVDDLAAAGGAQKWRLKHRTLVVAMVVAPAELVQVALQPLVRHLAVSPTDRGLYVVRLDVAQLAGARGKVAVMRRYSDANEPPY